MPSQVKKFIKVFEKETLKALSEIEKNQHPFAFAKSLTDVAQGAVLAVRQRTRNQFDLATEFIPKGVRRISAKKADIKRTGKAKAVVFTMDKISGFMPVHEEGGTRNPFGTGEQDKGRSFTIPSEFMSKSMETSTGRTKKRFKPKELLKNYKGRTSKGKPRSKASRVKEPFIIKGRGSGVPMIVRRKTKKRYPLKVLYIFTNRASYKPVWQFEDTVIHYVEQNFEEIYSKNLQMAIRNAK